MDFDILASPMANTQHGEVVENAPGNSAQDNIIRTKDVQVLSGGSTEIRCPTRGSIRPQLSWFKDGRPISPSNSFMPQGELLQLNNVDVSFAGEYSCKIVTEIGTTQRLTRLIVTGMLFDISEQVFKGRQINMSYTF